MLSRCDESRIIGTFRISMVLRFYGRHQIVFDLLHIKDRRSIVIPFIAGRQIRHDDNQGLNEPVFNHVVDHVFEAVAVFNHPCAFVAVCSMLKIQDIISRRIVIRVIAVRQINRRAALDGFLIPDVIPRVIRQGFKAPRVLCGSIIRFGNGIVFRCRQTRKHNHQKKHDGNRPFMFHCFAPFRTRLAF